MNPTSLPDPAPVRWIAPRAPERAAWSMPALGIAMGRGLAMRCPACGEAKLFQGYLTVTPVCPHCGAPLGLARADDAPPYFTIFIVAHVIVGAMLMLEQAYAPPLWVHAVIWLPLTLIMALLLLRPIKGATVALMLKLGMFKTGDEE
jgi:uncharacterized protein (DUF983 family)